MPRYVAPHALLPSGWAEDVLLEVDARGDLVRIEPGSTGGGERLSGPVLPGVPNLHSHAFQRAMAGSAERASSPEESFWSWREVMYRFAERIEPDDQEAIATQLYVEMLLAGYTSVAEFHYLHLPPGGGSYDPPWETSRRIVEAAQRTGIGLTLLPTLYVSAGLDGEPLAPAQRRFVQSPEALIRTVEAVAAALDPDRDRRVGLALHSLRAVPGEALGSAVDAVRSADPESPIHIHVAEQRREVDACLERLGARPVAWLLDHAPVDARWCLIHATHMDAGETRRLAETGAVAGLCPTTEANLGDGFFPLHDYLAAGGRFGIGSDSHVSVSPVEELRWLEYGQRLSRGERSVAARAASAGGRIPDDRVGSSTGRALVDGAVRGGAAAVGRPVGSLHAGHRADWIVLDPDHPALAGHEGDGLLDAWVFAAGRTAIRDVMVGGRWVVRDGHHPLEGEARESYARTVRRLTRGG